MRRFLLSCLLPALTAVFVLSGCKRDYSTDEPLTVPTGDMVYFGSSNQILRALDPRSGTLAWEYRLGTDIITTPFIDNKNLYVITVDGFIHTLEPATGQLLKKFSTRHAGLTTPVGDSALVFAGATIDTFVAYHPAGDSLKWRRQVGSPVFGSPLLYNGNLYFGTLDGSFYALKKNNGDLVWQVPSVGGPFLAAPTRMGNALFAPNADGTIYGMSIATGAVSWQFQAGGSIRSSPAGFNGALVFGCDDYYLYCVDTATRRARWKVKTQERITSSPFVYNDNVYVGSYDDSLHAFEFASGLRKWAFKTGRIIQSSPIVFNDILYVGSDDGYAYALNAGTGELIWKYYLGGQMMSSPVFRNTSGRLVYPTVSGAAKR